MSEIIKKLEEIDNLLKERIASIQNVGYQSERRKVAEVRLKIQEVINDLLLLQ